MINWDGIFDFWGFVLTGAISVLGFMGIIAVAALIVLVFIFLCFFTFEMLKERMK